MKNADKLRLWFVTVFTALNSLLGSLAVPFYILVGANVVDYVTGICAAVYRGEKVCSEVGFRGIDKKAESNLRFFCCLWYVAAGYDWLCAGLLPCRDGAYCEYRHRFQLSCLCGGGVLAACQRDNQHTGKYQRYRHTFAAFPFKAGGIYA